ncbi:MAG TPA: transcriptional regulator, partial [Acidobacteriota bacterium]|nr:transcriptional regulator [Acidobacteriota bacterium]
MQEEFRIAEWVVVPSLNRLQGPAGTVRLEPKVMRVLVELARRPGRVVTRQRLIETVWEGTFVGEETLTRTISELRKAFGDDPRSPRVIETIRKSGYRLLTPVEELASSAGHSRSSDPLSRPSQPSIPWRRWAALGFATA